MSRAEAWRSKAIHKDSNLVGRRMWTFSRDRERWRLNNIAHATDNYWPRGVYEADCTKWQQHSDRGPSPHPSCHCGLYAFWNWEELAAQYHSGHVTGVVIAWGRTLPGDEGFQSQFMMPIAIDYPRCSMGLTGGVLAGVQPSSCDEPAEWYHMAGVQYTEDYPTQFDEDWEIGFKWVNCKVGTGMAYCDKHSRDDGGRTLLNADNRNEFWVPSDTVMTDLERFYEVDILPAGDFGIDLERIEREVEEWKLKGGDATDGGTGSEVRP